MSTPIRAAVITVSDACSRGEREDDSGAALVELLTASGAEVVEKEDLVGFRKAELPWGSGIEDRR